PWRTRLLAYLGLACVGASFITLGTLCSRNAWLAAGAMAAVGFTTLFSGVISGYFAAASTGALLTFVLPVTIPAPSSAIPDRLEGWGLAAGAGICALMLLWPPRLRADLQRGAAGALHASAERLEGGDGRPDLARLDAARDAVAHALVRRLPELPTDTPAGAVPQALDPPFRIRAATYSARQVAGYALLATGAEAPELDDRDVVQPPPTRAALEATEQLAVEHASVRSV